MMGTLNWKVVDDHSSLQLVISGSKGEPSPHPASATPAAPTITNFANGPASQHKYVSLQKYQAGQTLGMLTCRMTALGQFWREDRYNSSAFLVLLEGLAAKKLCTTKAALSTTVLEITGPLDHI